jgi:hypothetical protein
MQATRYLLAYPCRIGSLSKTEESRGSSSFAVLSSPKSLLTFTRSQITWLFSTIDWSLA